MERVESALHCYVICVRDIWVGSELSYAVRYIEFHTLVVGDVNGHVVVCRYRLLTGEYRNVIRSCVYTCPKVIV